MKSTLSTLEEALAAANLYIEQDCDWIYLAIACLDQAGFLAHETDKLQDELFLKAVRRDLDAAYRRTTCSHCHREFDDCIPYSRGERCTPCLETDQSHD